MTTTVTTQAELDAALADESVYDIIIRSPRGVWLELSSSGSATVHAYGSATVHAYGSATVRAYGSATVRASDSATVRASDSATVHASGSATVHAYGSATVRASGSATVHAYDSATVRAGKYVAVHLHDSRVTVDGGVIIDVTSVNTDKAADWLDYHGVIVTDGKATVYKAVDSDLKAGQGYTVTNYPIGGTVIAPDWEKSQACGHGLHFSYAPHVAGGYFNGQGEPRYLEVQVDVAGMIALGDKMKSQSCTVIREVDITGRGVIS